MKSIEEKCGASVRQVAEHNLLSYRDIPKFDTVVLEQLTTKKYISKIPTDI